MLKMTQNLPQEVEEPPSTTTSSATQDDVKKRALRKDGVFSKLKAMLNPKNDASLRETIEEYIDDKIDNLQEESVSKHERDLISNVLDLRDLTAADVMVPRADIVAINEEIDEKELLKLFSEKQYSRLPVYKDTLDHVIGTLHVKDIMASISQNQAIDIQKLVREVPIISPSMYILDLLMEMRTTKKHMVLVVDEFGGIDGLVTIGDVIEDIVGEIDDEYISDETPEIITQTDGTIVADARVDLEEFEEQFGEILSEEERDENDTLGGLVFFMAGRVPARGEVLTHETGAKFEVLEADPRRVHRLCIRNIPDKNTISSE